MNWWLIAVLYVAVVLLAGGRWLKHRRHVEDVSPDRLCAACDNYIDRAARYEKAGDYWLADQVRSAHFVHRVKEHGVDLTVAGVADAVWEGDR